MNITRTFSNKQELAIALIKGKNYRVKGTPADKYCFFTEKAELMVESYNPFKYGTRENAVDNADLDGWWSCCNGIDEWVEVA